MNSKTVLSKILGLLSKDEVEMTYAKLADGTIVESATFDVGEDLFVVSEDGTKSPAPNGFHDLMLKDTEGNETLLKVKSEDGKIVERENVEMADAEMVKTQDIPAVGNEDKENVMPDLKGQVKSGTMMAETTEEVDPNMPETDGEPMEDDSEGEKEVEINLGKKMEEMVYRIEEMAAKIAKMEAMMPPLALNGVTSSTINFSSNVLQPSGSAYTASVSGSNDILSFVAFNSNRVNVVSTLKMI